MTNYTSAAEQYGRIPRSHCYQGTTDEWSSQEQLRTSDGLGKDFGPESLHHCCFSFIYIQHMSSMK